MKTGVMMGEAWGMRPHDWAELGEPKGRPAVEAVFAAAKLGPGTRLLDAGCGAGMALEMAHERGAQITGFDASEPLVQVARSRVPGTRIEIGDLEELPFEDATFDLVTGFNSFQFAGDIPTALREAKRVCRPGGQVAMCVWGLRDQCQSFATTISDMMALGPPPPPPIRPPLATEGVIESMFEEAGLTPQSKGDVPIPFEFRDAATAARAFLSSGMPAPVRQLGDDTIRKVILESLKPFTRADGSVRQDNVFHWALARRPA
jgi:SAM-dependent methyltransferase